MIRTLLLTSMMLASGQVVAFPVLYYEDIQRELVGLKHINPLEVLSLIEANLHGDNISLSSVEKMFLVQEFEALKSNLCKQRAGRLRLPFFIVAGTLLLFFINLNNAIEKQDILLQDGSSISRTNSYTAWELTGRSFGWLIINTFIGVLIEAEHNYHMDGCFVKEQEIEHKINNIIALLKQ